VLLCIHMLTAQDFSQIRIVLREEMKGVKTRLDSLESKIGSVETKLESLESRMEGVETKLDAVENSLTRVEKTTKDNGENILTLQKQTDNLEEKVDVLIGDVRQLQDTISKGIDFLYSRTNDIIRKVDLTFAEMDRRFNTLEKALGTTKVDVAFMSTDVEKLKAHPSKIAEQKGQNQYKTPAQPTPRHQKDGC
jgi:chromosome segregation ATPase